MTPRTSGDPTISELFEIGLGMLDNSIHRPNIDNYGELPYPEQERFHCSMALGRYISGGNRGGKTTAECVEAVWWATGTHPYLKRPKEWGRGPLKLRFVVVDVAKGVEQIILPELKRWTPDRYLVDGSWEKSWDAKNMILTFSNGSQIDFVTWGMEVSKLGGVARHIIFFDERPPQAIFNESTVRLIDYAGMWVMAATVVEGDIDWSYELLWEPANDPTKWQSEVIDTFTLSAELNPYNKSTGEQRNFYMVGMNDEERQVRESGVWVSKSGLVFPQFNADMAQFSVPPFVPPRGWDWYSSVDFGWRHPTAWLWHAVGPKGQIVTFGEHYMSHLTVPQHAEIVHLKEDEWRRIPDIRVGDPHGVQRTGQAGTSYISEYATREVNIQIDGIPLDVMIGVEKMQQYFEPRVDSPWLTDAEREAGLKRPMWVISENCPNFLGEMRKLRWESYESAKKVYESAPRQEIHKVYDDAFDSARYFATLMPDLTPIPSDYVAELTERGKVPVTISYAEMMAKLRDDDSVTFADDEYTDWAVTTEYEDQNG